MPPWELDGATLETKGACDFDGKLPFYVPFTAHPKTAPGTGELIFFGFNPVYPPHVSVGSVRPDGEMGEIKSLWHNALQGATFVHDFCVTTRHVVLFEGSMNIRPLRMAALRHPLAYDETQKARFGVLRRRANGTIPGVEVDEDVVWCECESHEMVYHFVNAWEDEGSGEREGCRALRGALQPRRAGVVAGDPLELRGGAPGVRCGRLGGGSADRERTRRSATTREDAKGIEGNPGSDDDAPRSVGDGGGASRRAGRDMHAGEDGHGRRCERHRRRWRHARLVR